MSNILKNIARLSLCLDNVAIPYLDKVDTLRCVSKCRTCDNHGNGLCTDYCSKFNYCGKGRAYRPINGGIDCRKCGNQEKNYSVFCVFLSFCTHSITACY